MATTAEYMEFVRDCMSPYGEVKSRKMFGEYAMYIDGKLVALVCDNCVFVKKLPELAELMAGVPCGLPYDGAREHYIVDPEDSAFLSRLMPTLIEYSKPTKKKKKPTANK